MAWFRRSQIGDQLLLASGGCCVRHCPVMARRLCLYLFIVLYSMRRRKTATGVGEVGPDGLGLEDDNDEVQLQYGFRKRHILCHGDCGRRQTSQRNSRRRNEKRPAKGMERE